MPESWNMALGGIGSLKLDLKGMRIMMFQLSGFYFKRTLNPKPYIFRAQVLRTLFLSGA